MLLSFPPSLPPKGKPESDEEHVSETPQPTSTSSGKAPKNVGKKFCSQNCTGIAVGAFFVVLAAVGMIYLGSAAAQGEKKTNYSC